MILMHRFILGLEKGDEFQADHKNRNRLDNRRRNLRKVLRGQQSHNMQRKGDFTSKHRGVSWDKKTNKWVACVHTQGRKHVAGYFVNENEAANAARKIRRQLLSHSLD